MLDKYEGIFKLESKHPPLSTVKVGDRVWMKTQMFSFAHRGTLATYQTRTITRIDKNGRLYFVNPDYLDKKGPRIAWRWGFDPATGEAKEYSKSELFAIRPDELEAIQAADTQHAREVLDANQKADAKREAEAKAEAIRQAAPDLLEALKSLREAFRDLGIKRDVRKHYHLMVAEAAADKAIRKAEGQ